MDERTNERMAQNEDVFRQINETIDLAALSHGPDHHRYEFFCECSDLSCVERIGLTLEEYAFARAEPTRFVVIKGHSLADVERIVGEDHNHVFVEKNGAAGETATELDD
jgi:hypothetical protein